MSLFEGGRPASGAAAATAFDWKKFLLSAQGRITRFDYWMRYAVPYLAIYIVLAFADHMIGTVPDGMNVGLLGIVFSLAAIYPGILVGIKRCHDRDKSGWWLLLVFIPVIGAIWALVELGCLRGTVGNNRFGPDPLDA